jgi:hypothetical protein
VYAITFSNGGFSAFFFIGPAFMDRFLDWHVQITAGEPIHILASVSWLPAPLAPDLDEYWTPACLSSDPQPIGL